MNLFRKNNVRFISLLGTNVLDPEEGYCVQKVFKIFLLSRELNCSYQSRVEPRFQVFLRENEHRFYNFKSESSVPK